MNDDLVYSILGQLGRAKRADDRLTITGDGDPVFQTPWRVGTAGAAALGAVGLAVSDLWRLRTGKPQWSPSTSPPRPPRCAPTPTSCATARGRLVGSAVRPLSDARRAAHVHPHKPSAPSRRRTAHRRCRGDTREALAAAVAKWDGLAIEEAIAAGGCVGGLTRSREEWNAHPHGIAVAKLPLIDIVKIGDAPAEPLPTGDRPLSGIRAFDLTRVLAGPTSGRVLAENGADVLHVAAPHLPYQAELLMDTGHGKRCAWIDLREPAGVETMKALLKDADIFTQGYRPGTLAARGFSPEQVAALRPGIVCVSLCAYGHEGPWSQRRGFDSIVQNVTGLAATQGSLDKPRNLPSRRSTTSRAISARWRAGGAGPPGRAGRLVAGSRLAGAGRALAGEPRHGRRLEGRGRTFRHGADPPPHRERRPAGPPSPPEAGGSARRDTGLLRPARRTARHLARPVGLSRRRHDRHGVAGTDWSSAELDLIVADYFAMLKEEQAGQTIRKTEHRRALKAQIPRSDGSIEFKHQNISAVLTQLGLPRIRGYVPAWNFQAQSHSPSGDTWKTNPICADGDQTVGGIRRHASPLRGTAAIKPPDQREGQASL